MSVEIRVPEIGESITEVQIGRWLKTPGDAVALDEPLVEIESDKATLEIPAPAGGALARILKTEGEKAAVGDVIAVLDETVPARKSKDAPPAKSQELPAVPEPALTAAPPVSPAMDVPQTPVAMPAAKRLMDEFGLRPDQIPPTGPGGRILKEDVLSFMHASMETPASPEAPAPQQTPTSDARQPDRTRDTRSEETVPMSPMRHRIAERLLQAQQGAALLTTFNEIDMSRVQEMRHEFRDRFEQKHGVRLGLMSFFVRAVVDALRELPQLNAEIRGDTIVYRNYFDIGIAVASGKGLVVPVLRNAENMSFADMETTIRDFATRAKENRVTLEELKGGTFSITNGGVYGSLLSTPIVNPPQSGILGLHAIQDRPIALNGQVVIRPMMYVALTYDHRIVDGREAVTFLRRIKDCVENPSRMLLEI